jgi:CheY-like chemotaxis protein
MTLRKSQPNSPESAHTGGAPARAEPAPPPQNRALLNQLQITTMELRQRLQTAENDRAQLAKQLETLQAGKGRANGHAAPAAPAAAPAPARGTPPSPQVELLRTQNADLNRRVEELQRTLLEFQKHSGGPQKNFAEAQKNLAEAQKNLEAAKEQISTLRMARDSAQAQNRDLTQKLAQREDEIAELRDALAAPRGHEESPDLVQLRAAHAQTTASLAAAEKRIEKLVQAKEESIEQALAAQLELANERERFAAYEAAAGTVPAETILQEVAELREQKRTLSARLEAQRLEAIELAARFEATQEQIKTVSASLAEARLMAKANRDKPAAPPAELAAPALPENPSPTAVSPEPLALPLPVVEPFPTAHAASTVREMRRCYQAYAQDLADLSHLNELHCIVLSFAEQAGQGGARGLQGIADALAVLVQELYNFPEQINKDVLLTVVGCIEFFTTGLKQRDLCELREAADATVCIVDDDAATGECLLLAMESVNLRAGSFLDPVKALGELSTGVCDLIVLDVHMPVMDGLSLCAGIRELKHHRRTPILFVTGQSEGAARDRCMQAGGDDFMSKPFMLCELGLKALLLIAKAQLQMN